MGAVAVDRPTLFIQGTILVLAFASVLLIGDSSNSPFAAQAAAPPGSQEERERKKADEKCSRLKAHRYLLPVLATAEAFTGPANSESWPIGMKKFAAESCPASTTIVLRKNPAVLCHATMVYLPGDTSGMRYCPARSALGTSDSE